MDGRGSNPWFEGTVDTIIAWHTDRLYRDPLDLEGLIDLIEGDNRQVRILTVQSGDMDQNTSAGRMVARMLGAAARAEVEHKAERQARKHQEIAEAGRWGGGPRPLGFRSDGITIYETEAAALRQAAQRIIAGHGITATTRWFNEVLRRDSAAAVETIALKRALIARGSRACVHTCPRQTGTGGTENVEQGCTTVRRSRLAPLLRQPGPRS